MSKLINLILKKSCGGHTWYFSSKGLINKISKLIWPQLHCISSANLRYAGTKYQLYNEIRKQFLLFYCGHWNYPDLHHTLWAQNESENSGAFSLGKIESNLFIK